jgi:hypothetical protein
MFSSKVSMQLSRGLSMLLLSITVFSFFVGGFFEPVLAEAVAANSCTQLTRGDNLASCSSSNLNVTSDIAEFHIPWKNIQNVNAGGKMQVVIAPENGKNPSDFFDVISVIDTTLVRNNQFNFSDVNIPLTSVSINAGSIIILYTPAQNPASISYCDSTTLNVDFVCNEGLPVIPASSEGFTKVSLQLKPTAPIGQYSFFLNSFGTMSIREISGFPGQFNERSTRRWLISGNISQPKCENGAINFPGCNQCKEGEILSNNACIIPSCTNKAMNYPLCNQCPVGQVFVGAFCEIPVCTNDAINYPNCDRCENTKVFINRNCVDVIRPCSPSRYLSICVRQRILEIIRFRRYW